MGRTEGRTTGGSHGSALLTQAIPMSSRHPCVALGPHACAGTVPWSSTSRRCMATSGRQVVRRRLGGPRCPLGAAQNAAHRLGRSAHPTGNTAHPLGRVAHPFGRAAHRLGRTAHPVGPTAHPLGPSAHPSGHAGDGRTCRRAALAASPPPRPTWVATREETAAASPRPPARPAPRPGRRRAP